MPGVQRLHPAAPGQAGLLLPGLRTRLPQALPRQRGQALPADVTAWDGIVSRGLPFPLSLEGRETNKKKKTVGVVDQCPLLPFKGMLRRIGHLRAQVPSAEAAVLRPDRDESRTDRPTNNKTTKKKQHPITNKIIFISPICWAK